MFKDKLLEIGFSESEAQIYIELLKIGPQAASIIAKRLGLNRTTAYSILKSLEKKGVIASYTNSNVKYFTANDPNSLIGYLDRKCRTFDYYRDELLAVIPQFRSLNGNCTFKKPIVSYFEGIEGVKHVMYDALDAKDEFRAYLALHKWFELGLKDFLLEYKDIRIENKRVPLRAIAPDTAEIREFFKENYDLDNEMTKVLYIANLDYLRMFENEMNIYDDKVAIIRLNKGDEYGVIVQSKEIADMHKLIFDMAWMGFEITNKKKV